MKTFTIEINELQMDLINRALLQLQTSHSERCILNDEHAEEVNILMDLVDVTKDEEQQDPGAIHGWCY